MQVWIMKRRKINKDFLGTLNRSLKGPKSYLSIPKYPNNENNLLVYERFLCVSNVFSIRLGFNLPFLASTTHNKVKTRNENNNIQASARQCDDSLFPLNFDQDKKPVVKIFQYWVNYSSWREWQVKALAIQCLELHYVFEMPSENQHD